MRVFISWSGQRSRALGSALRNWLSKVIPGISFFDSEEIPKGKNWHVEVIKALRGCSIGIFCITPENLRSQWVLFEAGALAQHGDQPTLLTYTIGPVELTGPLSHFQSPRVRAGGFQAFRSGIRQVGRHRGRRRGAASNVQRDLGSFSISGAGNRPRETRGANPGLLFAVRGQEDVRRALSSLHGQTIGRSGSDAPPGPHHILSSAEYGKFLAGAQEVADAYEALLNALDRYDMHIGALLLKPVEYADLRQANQDLLEQARQRVVDEVRKLKELPSDTTPVSCDEVCLEALPAWRNITKAWTCESGRNWAHCLLDQTK